MCAAGILVLVGISVETRTDDVTSKLLCYALRLPCTYKQVL